MDIRQDLQHNPKWGAIILSGPDEAWLDAYRTVSEELEDLTSESFASLVTLSSAVRLTALRTFSGQFSIPVEEVEFVESLSTRWNLKETGARSGVAGFKLRRKGSQGNGILVRVEVQEIGLDICQITQAQVSLPDLDLE